MVDTIFKIKNNKTGLFSMGGSTPRWTKKGKIWRNKGALSNHLALVQNVEHVYADCEVITFVLSETQVDVMTMADYINSMTERRDAREAARKRALDEYRLKEQTAHWTKWAAAYPEQAQKILDND